MELIPGKPPHKKLQNDVAGIDIDIGSIYVIPAATDYMDEEDLGPIAAAPHQLINFGPNQEKVLIIPDYRVTRVVPGVERKKLIASTQMVKSMKDGEVPHNNEQSENSDNNKSSNSSETRPPNSSSTGTVHVGREDSLPKPTSAELERILSVSYREKNQVTPTSPLSSLGRFEGAEGAVLLDMFESWGITNLQLLSAFPTSHPDGVALLKETGMFADIAHFSGLVAALLESPPQLAVQQHAPSSSPPNSNPSSKQSEPISADNSYHNSPGNTGASPPNPQDLGSSRMYPQGVNPRTSAGIPAPCAPSGPIPLSKVPGITAAVAETLARFALIQTAQDLHAFPTKFPGLYSMMKDAHEVDDLDALIAAAAQCCNAAPTAAPLSASPLASSSWLHHLGEAQRPQLQIQDVTRNTLVGALKGMSTDLASQLANLYPPIHSLQALATFAEVSPTEYTYLLRSYPELSELCQEAALLVSVAVGRPRPSSK